MTNDAFPFGEQSFWSADTEWRRVNSYVNHRYSVARI